MGNKPAGMQQCAVKFFQVNNKYADNLKLEAYHVKANRTYSGGWLCRASWQALKVSVVDLLCQLKERFFISRRSLEVVKRGNSLVV